VIELYFIECMKCITIHKWGVSPFISGVYHCLIVLGLNWCRFSKPRDCIVGLIKLRGYYSNTKRLYCLRGYYSNSKLKDPMVGFKKGNKRNKKKP
jgi:hypothetical protein